MTRTRPKTTLAAGCAAIVVFTALLAGCASAPVSDADIAAVDRLLALIAERLKLAPALATARWDAAQPIEDPVREREVVEAAVARSVQHVLPPEVVYDVFEAQNEASRIVQLALHAQWRKENRAPATNHGDNARALWKQIADLTPRTLEGLSTVYPILRREGGRELLERRAQTAFTQTPGGMPAATAAIAPLWEIAK